MKKLLIVALIILLAGVVYASFACPIDNMSMYFTGKTKTEMGKLLKQYKCPLGHTTWVVD